MAGLWQPAARLRDSAASLFAPVRRTRISPAAVLGAALAIMLAAACGLSRVDGAMATIWPGTGANAIGWWLAALTIGPALIGAATAVLVYVASGNILLRPLPRAVSAGWIVAAPLAMSTETFGPDLIPPLQFVELYGLFWVLMWTPARPLARLVQIAFVTLCCLGSVPVALFIPLAAVRVWAVGTRWSESLLSLVVAGAGFQAVELILGLTHLSDSARPRFDPLWALEAYVGWGLPFGVVGPKTMSDAGIIEPGEPFGGGGFWYWSGVVVTWLVVVAVILVARQRLTRPQWLFAALAAGQSVLVFCGHIMVHGRLEPRYAYPASLLVIAALLALLRPVAVSRHEPRIAWFGAWFPTMALTCLLVLCAAANYRTRAP